MIKPWMHTLSAAAALLLIGCNPSEESSAPSTATPTPTAPAPVAETPTGSAPSAEPSVVEIAKDQYAKVTAAFAQATPERREAVASAIKQLQSSNYSGAVAELQKLLGDAQLTPEQQQLLKDLLVKAKEWLAKETQADPAKAISEATTKLPFDK